MISPAPASGQPRIFSTLWVYLRPQAGRMLLLASILLASIGLQLIAPLILRRFIDGVAARPLPALWALAGGFLAATAAAQGARIVAAWLSSQVGWAATNRLRGDLTDHCLRLDLAFLKATPPGALIERLDGDVTLLAGFFSEFVIQILGGALLIGGIVVVLFAEDWRIGAALGALAIAAFVLMRVTRNLSAPSVALERESRADLAGFLEERMGGLEDIRPNAGGAHVLRGLDAVTPVLNARAGRAGLIGRLIWVLTAGIFVVASLTALSLGIFLFQRGLATLGQVYLFVQYAALMRDPLNQIGSQLQDVQRASASLGRVGALMARKPSLGDGSGVVWPSGPPEVVFDAVDFAYGDGPLVLSAVTFTLAPGQVLGLIGRTGAGKTTLIRLLARLHDPTSGAVRLDGHDLRAARLDQLRARIGVVSQDVQLFSASVRDNASLFDPSVADTRIAEVLDDIGLGPWLARQRDGLDTMLSTHASLSAGEGQLLAFARVFLKDPDLVILDEATSRLDPLTDRLVEQALSKLIAGPRRRTVVIIAHKLTTLGRADQILVLEGGRVVEAGARAALARDAGSRFARLVAAASDGALR